MQQYTVKEEKKTVMGSSRTWSKNSDKLSDKGSVSGQGWARAYI